MSTYDKIELTSRYITSENSTYITSEKRVAEKGDYTHGQK